MAYSFLIFDFGRSEDAAQKARHRIDGWKQGFRLDKKLQVKFERQEEEAKPDATAAASKPKSTATAKASPKGKAKQKAKGKSEEDSAATSDSPSGESSDIRLIVRLDFSDHEKLSHQRWLERIPSEDPFKTASPKIVRAGDPEFQTVSDLFDSLD